MRDSLGEKIFYVINYFLLLLLGLTCTLPLINIAAMSLSSSTAILSGFVGLWPVETNLDAYKSLFLGTNIIKAFNNSVLLTLVGVVLSMVATIAAAYPLSRPYFYGRRFFTLAIVFTMLFGGGIIPAYLVIKSLGLINTYGAIWLPSLVAAYNMLVMKAYFENLPAEVEDAARIDGCSEWQLIGKVILPLSMPVIAALSLFYGVGFWNSFMNVLIYINDSSKLNLAVLVNQMVQNQRLLQEINQLQPEDLEQMTPESIKAAAVVVMLAPMLAVYPFLQKYFVKGVMIGAVKG